MKGQKLKFLRSNLISFLPLLLVGLMLIAGLIGDSYSSSAHNLEDCFKTKCTNSTIKLDNGCGAGNGYVQTSIDFGCSGNSCSTTPSGSGYCDGNRNGIEDLLFAIIRFLSDGVGLIVIASIIVGGIQYITSRGDPNATNAAIKRLTSAVVALLVYIFAYAILNYVIPVGFFQQ